MKGGRILAVGSRAAINRHRGKVTVDLDLAGRALLPGFIDGHGHVAIGGLQAYSIERGDDLTRLIVEFSNRTRAGSE